MSAKRRAKKPAASERGMGVLLEQMDGKIDLLVEGHQKLNEKIDRVDGKVDDLKKEMDYKLGVVVDELHRVDKKVDDLKKEGDYRFEIVLDELHIIRDDLKERVSRERFAILEKRVSTIEKKIA